MRIAVFGVGGVGGYFGARLAQAGEEVIFIARGEHLEAISQQGLRLESPKGDHLVYPAACSADPVQVGRVDVVLVGVKAWQVPEAAQAIRPLVDAGTVVIPLQNGVEAPDQLASVLDLPGKQRRVLGGLCRISSYIAGPGHIRHVGIEPYIAFGALDGLLVELAARLVESFRRSGVQAEIPNDIRMAMWKKFVFIASISGVGAVARLPVGEVRQVPQTRHLLLQALEETAAVGRGCRVNLPQDTALLTLAQIDSLPPGTIPSMQRDILERRPSELDSQTGAVVRLGEQCAIPTPVHAFLYAALLPAELSARHARSA